MYRVDSGRCTCDAQHCVDECPMGAISLDDGAVAIDHGTCLECGACVEVCPNSALSLP